LNEELRVFCTFAAKSSNNPIIMDETTYVSLLEEHGIKPTANRIVLARALASSMQPQSLAELERRILTIDKSNIFRGLMLFREHHLVHAIEGSNDGTKYELCHSHNHDHDDDQHPHFYCEQCHETYCLDYADMPEIALPEGFEATSANLMIKGTCPHCQKR
jgi:Fur family ferric uptake transcriptional regulator